jgi:eukaryotic-like serine/threonine-protein kinase
MLTSSGSRVKVLDFGLAKPSDAQAVNAALSTNTAPITSDGRIVGTIAYMSPEQAEGKPVDARSDVFSLGVMLFEMATGRRPFGGATNISVITAILRDAPPSLTDVKAGLPLEFARIVRRCLQKEPDRRFQTAVDLRNALEELKQESDSGMLAPGAVTRPAPPSRPRRAAVLGATGLVAVAGAAGWLALGNRSGREQRSAAVEIRERQVTSNPIDAPVFFAAISADGRYVAYSDIRGLHVRFIETGETRTIPTPPEFCFT